jgi:hypothetical protein
MRDRAGLFALLVVVPVALTVVTLLGGTALRHIDPFLPLYLLAFAVVVGGGLLVGFLFKWWGLLASVGFACFLAYGWEFSSEGVAYPTIAGVLSCGAVVVGSLIRTRAQEEQQ